MHALEADMPYLNHTLDFSILKLQSCIPLGTMMRIRGVPAGNVWISVDLERRCVSCIICQFSCYLRAWQIWAFVAGWAQHPYPKTPTPPFTLTLLVSWYLSCVHRAAGQSSGCLPPAYFCVLLLTGPFATSIATMNDMYNRWCS